MSVSFFFLILFSVCSAACILVWFVFGGLRDFKLDQTRQDLFKIRNDLFDLASAGTLDFNEDSYRIVRATLNGSIKFLEDLSFWRVILFLVFSKSRGDNPIIRRKALRREKALAVLPPERRKIYEDAIGNMHIAILQFAIESSIFAFSILWIFICFTKCRDFFGERVDVIAAILKKSAVQSKFRIYDEEAAIVGSV